jgi:prevent-host-death family protein
MEHPRNGGEASEIAVTDLKNRLSEVLRLVRRGETVEVLERNVPIARLQPIREPSADDGHLARLLRDGIATRPAAPANASLVADPPTPCEIDLVERLRQERDGR